MKLITLFLLAFLFAACTKEGKDINSKFMEINGTFYPTVVIGNQTWTSVNYNGPGGVNYDDSLKNDPIYGKLYNYTEVEAIKLPKGWHVPTYDDCVQLLIHLGAKDNTLNIYRLPDTLTYQLMSQKTWTPAVGTNKIGFNAVGAGVWWTSTLGITGYAERGKDCEILTSTISNIGEHVSLSIIDEGIIEAWPNDVIPKTTDRGSVRFVKDN